MLAKDNWRATLADEPEPGRPEVALVGKTTSASCDTEGLARAAPGPNWEVIWPRCERERSRPATDPGKGVEGPDTGEVPAPQLSDVSIIDSSIAQMSSLNEVSEPLDGVWLELVVE